MSGIEEDPEQPKRRILCIDGGGILGTFPAAFLAELEQHLAHPIGSYFDLIAGTSTGGILAIGLAMGLTASELLDLYEKRGPEIFGQDHNAFAGFVHRRLRGFRWLYRRKYDSDALRAVLEDVLGGWSCPVFVDTFRLWGGGVQMPKTHSPYAPEYRRQMVELVRSGRTPGELAREFECSASAIRNWVRQADRDEGRREDGLTSSELEELRRLRRDNRQLREEREILAKATAWFARETGSVRAKSSSS